MQLGCTKKLQDYLKLTPAAADPTLDPFFTWTATLMVRNRHKVIVMSNDKTHCGFVLNGVTAPMRRKLDQYIFEGIREMLYHEGFVPELIDQYLADCGSQISYTKTKDRSTVAKFNRFMKDLDYCREPWYEGELYQPRISHWINSGLCKDESNYFRAREALCMELAERYDCDSPYACDMVVISVKLNDTDCVRELRIPLNYTLSQLHEVIQSSFSWNDTHLHAFYSQQNEPLYVLFPQYIYLALEDDWVNDTEPMEHAITLQEMFAATSKFTYLYDFGDNWEHTIEFVRMEQSCPTPFCQCLLASGDAPPEDVGGPCGFREFLKIIHDPRNPKSDETMDWALWQNWRSLDVDHINYRIGDI